MVDRNDPGLTDNLEKTDGARAGLAAAQTDSIFTDNSQKAQNDRVFQEASTGGVAGFSSVAGVKTAQELAQEKEEKRDALASYLQIQILLLEQDIAGMEERLREYQDKMNEANLTIESATASIHILDDVIENVSAYKGQSYADFLRDNFGDTALSAESGNIWEALQNPLTDEQGNLVHLDEQGVYRVETNPDTGLPARIYYEAQEATALMDQAFNGDPPKVFANYTFKSQDPGNTHVLRWVNVPVDADLTALLPGHHGAQNGANMSYALSVSAPLDSEGVSMDAVRQVCDQYRCIMVEIKEEAALSHEKFAGLAEETEIDLVEARSKLADLKGEEPHEKEEVTETVTQWGESDSPEFSFDERRAALDQALRSKTENGVITIDALRDMVDGLSAENKQYLLGKIHERGIQVIDPRTQSLVNPALPEVFGGIGPAQKINPPDPHAPRIDGLNTMPSAEMRHGSRIKSAFEAAHEGPAPEKDTPQTA